MNSIIQLGKYISSQRLSQSLRQKDVAIISGLSVRTIRNIEAGKNTSSEALIKVLVVLGLFDAVISAIALPTISPLQRASKNDARTKKRVRIKVTQKKALWGEDLQ